MNKNWKLALILLYLSLSQALFGLDNKEIEASLNVIQRFSGDKKIPVKIDSIEKQDGCDVFETSVKDGVLNIKGSSGVAVCRGFYDFVKSQKAGISSWTGSLLNLGKAWTQAQPKKVVSPFNHHYYFNVVTFGYTTPYWDWKRWEAEIDWMALHGIDMPLALVANEAISARVWKKLGLSDEESFSFFSGPAHLPWMRMGNARSVDGPLPLEWHSSQIALQHKILKKMHSLGMKPICPGFAGFVPEAIKRIYPDVKLISTGWYGSFPNCSLISPEQKLFSKLGEMFIQEWEKEFGMGKYYIADTFNEMHIKLPEKKSQERADLLASFGNSVYSGIKKANSEAVWVMQGWMFGYQRDVWDYDSLNALTSTVPNDNMLILDLAVDYSKYYWDHIFNWEFYKGFFNKPWVYSVIPNMGGDSVHTGVLEFYANNHLEALISPNRGNLVGFGMAPEGVENNEIVYELLSDAGWSDKKIDLNQWMMDYAHCRYGSAPEKLKGFYSNMLSSIYGSLRDHPRHNWQYRPGSVLQISSMDTSFFKGVEELSKCAPELKESPLYRADLAEFTAAYLAYKAEILTVLIEQAYQYEDFKQAKKLEDLFTEILMGMDTVLQASPTASLERWVAFSQKHEGSPEIKDYYASNARRIVTVWGPPLNDYAAKVWSGLIRDYYLPRWQHYFATKKSKQSFNFDQWELDWVKNHTMSPRPKCSDVVKECFRLLNIGKTISFDNKNKGEILGTWSPSNITTEWKEFKWQISPAELQKTSGILFNYVRGASKLDIAEVSIEMDGEVVFQEKRSGSTGTVNMGNYYKLTVLPGKTGNNGCFIKALIKSEPNTDSYGNVELIKVKK